MPLSSRLFKALPPYFGGKRRLLQHILPLLASELPQVVWPKATLLDAFSGGGSVSLAAALSGFKEVVSNDWSTRGYLISKGLLASGNQAHYQTLLQLNQPVDHLDNHWIIKNYAHHVFTPSQASSLAQWRENIETITDPSTQALWLVILWHSLLQFVAFPTSLGTSNRPFVQALEGLKSWDDVPAKRLQDGSLKSLTKPPLQVLQTMMTRINQRPVVPKGKVLAHQEDIATLIPKTKATIGYFDPPYAGTLKYEQANQILDRILTNNSSYQEPTSTYSASLDGFGELLRQSEHIPYWLISYGTKAIPGNQFEEWLKDISPHRATKVVRVGYKHLSHVSHDDHHEEIVALAWKGGVDV